jgi:hypothetical protein
VSALTRKPRCKPLAGGLRRHPGLAPRQVAVKVLHRAGPDAGQRPVLPRNRGRRATAASPHPAPARLRRSGRVLLLRHAVYRGRVAARAAGPGGRAPDPRCPAAATPWSWTSAWRSGHRRTWRRNRPPPIRISTTGWTSTRWGRWATRSLTGAPPFSSGSSQEILAAGAGAGLLPPSGRLTRPCRRHHEMPREAPSRPTSDGRGGAGPARAARHAERWDHADADQAGGGGRSEEATRVGEGRGDGGAVSVLPSG